MEKSLNAEFVSFNSFKFWPHPIVIGDNATNNDCFGSFINVCGLGWFPIWDGVARWTEILSRRDLSRSIKFNLIVLNNAIGRALYASFFKMPVKRNSRSPTSIFKSQSNNALWVECSGFKYEVCTFGETKCGSREQICLPRLIRVRENHADPDDVDNYNCAIFSSERTPPINQLIEPTDHRQLKILAGVLAIVAGMLAIAAGFIGLVAAIENLRSLIVFVLGAALLFWGFGVFFTSIGG